uniref:Uncharacterized protein n=1 Tax=Arundo donax TaxID=35708 RepID=A0A0A9HSC1_ARUDO
MKSIIHQELILTSYEYLKTEELGNFTFKGKIKLSKKCHLRGGGNKDVMA